MKYRHIPSNQNFAIRDDEPAELHNLVSHPATLAGFEPTIPLDGIISLMSLTVPSACEILFHPFVA
jgi:hypothetical protein